MSRRIRKDPEIDTLLQLGSEYALPGTYMPLETRHIFKKARRLIGKLAAYIRVCEELVEDGSRLGALL